MTDLEMCTKNGIKEVQESLLELLVFFDSICNDNGIKYSLHGGTLLGAVRDHGFIPWDDDLDVTFSREEFNKFKRVIKEKDNHNIWFDELAPSPKLWMKTPSKPVAWIDIFVYDYISEKKLAQHTKLIIESFLLNFLKNRATFISLKSTTSKFAYWVRLFLNTLGSIFPKTFWLKTFTWFSSKCLCGKKEIVHRSNDTPVGRQMILDKTILDHYEYKKFEGHELMVSSQYHTILVSSYGNDYMIPKKLNVNDSGHLITRENVKWDNHGDGQ